MNASHLCGAVAASGALLLVNSGCSHSTRSAAAVPAAASSVIRVTAGKPLRKTLVVETTQPARIEAFEEAPLFSKLAGYVKNVHVDIGDKVSKDAPLVTLWIPELNDDVEQKTALVAQAEAQSKQADANREASQAAVDTADAKVAESKASTLRAKAEYERWKSEYERIKELVAHGSVTQKLADETLNQLRAAEASRDEVSAAIQSAEAAAHEARANVAKADADRVAANARLRVAQADLDHAKTMLAYTSIRAPFDGIVTKRNVDPGHFVQPAAGGAALPLLVVARSDKVRVYLEIPEMEAAAVDVGDPATIRVQALRGRQLAAPVARTSWSLDPSNRSLRAEVDLPNNQSLLRPGMYATGTIVLDKRDQALTIPASAVVRDGDATYCCCVESGKIARLPVELGLRSGQDVEVLRGIDDATTIVLMRADSLVQGQKVEAIAPM